DRLRRQAAGGSDDLDVLPVLEENGASSPFAFGEADDKVNSGRFADKDTKHASSRPPAGEEPATVDEDEVLPVLEEVERGCDWHLPRSTDLRDRLSEASDPKARKRGDGR